MEKKPEFWVMNISREKDISLGDLRLTIRRGTSVNLLGHKFGFSLEQLKKSQESGSIYKKGNYIKVREHAPVVFSTRLDKPNNDRSMMKPHRKITVVEPKIYEEFMFDEPLDRNSMLADQESFAKENADIDFLDKMPLLPVDPKFKKTDE